MKTNEFYKKITSARLEENIEKQFGAKINLDKYDREQLEDIRNKLRTRVFQQEGAAGINDLLTNETYQKNKAMLELLNTRIKEMLGENIKHLKDKMIELSEAKKAKGKDRTGDGTSNFDDIQVARMTAGGVPKKKAIAKATDDKFEENRVIKGKSYGNQPDADDSHPEKKSPKGSSEITAADRAKDKAADAARDRAGKDWEARGYKRTVVKGKSQSSSKEVDEAVEKCNDTAEGKMCEVHGKKACPKIESVVAKKKDKKVKEPFAVGMATAKKQAGVKKTPATNLPKAVVKKGHEIGKSIKKSQKDESTNIFRRNVKIVNESLVYLLAEDEEEKAKAITAASDMVNDFTSWMQRVGQYQTKAMIELADEIRHNFGAAEADTFKQSVGPALTATLDTLSSQREAISNAVAVLAGEQAPMEPMGTDPAAELPMEPGMEPAAPDDMNVEPDEFSASDAAAGAGTSGREMRESQFARKLAESHSIMSKLAK